MQKFTILTSLFNSDMFIDDYFETAFNQLALPDQIVLIDDGKNTQIENTINEKKIKYKFKNIILIKNETNLGPAISLNKGLTICSNNLIFRLDVDDLWLPNHTKQTLEYYLKDSSYLIYANSLIKKNFLTRIKCDKYFINENPIVHSSWLINRNICKNFRYRLRRPSIALEDYYTLLYYKWHGFKFFTSDYKTTIYRENILSHGFRNKNNIKYQLFRKKISLLFFKFNFKNKTPFQKIYFFLFEYGLIKFAVLIFWILDYIRIKKNFYFVINKLK